MRRSADFAYALRAGRRARRGSVVVHQVRPQEDVAEFGARARTDAPSAARVGLIVSKAVGGSVMRHRVSRRLRAQLAQRVQLLPAGSSTVVRALPAAAQARSARLGADLEHALRSVAAGR